MAKIRPADLNPRTMAKQRVDLQELVEGWAWEYFGRRAEKKERKLMEKQQISMEVDWKKVSFVHEDPVYDPEPPTPGAGKPINNVLFCTTFSNKTDKPQTYTFKAQRTTRSSCSVNIEEACTRGMELGIKLATPNNILEANAGFKREITLTNSKGETVEEELSWGVDSEIEVEKSTRAEAKLIIIEEEYSGRFSVKSMASGRVRAVFYNLKDNNAFIKAMEGDIDDIIKRARDDGKIKGDTVVVDKDTRSIICKTAGTCSFRYGLRQEVEVDQFDL